MSLGTGSIVYTPPAGFSGSDSFFITVTDALGASRTGLASVAVRPSASAGGSGTTNPPELFHGGGTVLIRFHAIPGFFYAVQRSADLASWETIHTGTAGITGVLEYTDEDPPSPGAYYRLNTP